jgi:hypothetical protein
MSSSAWHTHGRVLMGAHQLRLIGNTCEALFAILRALLFLPAVCWDIGNANAMEEERTRRSKEPGPCMDLVMVYWR